MVTDIDNELKNTVGGDATGASQTELPKRKPTRLKNFDYSAPGVYFITICTQNRRCLLSHVVGGDVPDAPEIQLTRYGQIADKYINQLNDFYDNLSVEKYVIMPNHIHILLWIKNGKNGASRTSRPTKQHSTVSQFVSTFKRFCNKEYDTNVWQRHFNDHIIRNHEDYEEHLRYIYENPVHWYFDDLYVE